MRELIQFIRTHIADVKFEVKLAQSRLSSLEPVVLVHAPEATSHRETTAALFVLAGEVSLRTGPKERWCVRVEPCGDTEGRVYLELATSTETEAARGIRLLEEIVK
jgi:hypothetical protein